MQYTIYETDTFGSIGLKPTDTLDECPVEVDPIHTFEVSVSDEVRKTLAEFWDEPSACRAAGYFHEYLGHESYRPPKWDDMSEEEYELAKGEALKGEQKCQNASHSYREDK